MTDRSWSTGGAGLFRRSTLGVVPSSPRLRHASDHADFHDSPSSPIARVVPATSPARGSRQRAGVAARRLGRVRPRRRLHARVAELGEGDIKGPVPLAVTVTGKLKELGLTPPEGVTEARLVAVGTPMPRQPAPHAAPFNGDLLLNIMDGSSARTSSSRSAPAPSPRHARSSLRREPLASSTSRCSSSRSFSSSASGCGGVGARREAGRIGVLLLLVAALGAYVYRVEVPEARGGHQDEARHGSRRRHYRNHPGLSRPRDRTAQAGMS